MEEEKRIAQKLYYWRKKGFPCSSIREIEEIKARLKETRREARLKRNREKLRQKRQEMKKALEYYNKNVLHRI